MAQTHSVLQRPAPPGRKCAPRSPRSRAQGTRRLRSRSRPESPPVCSGEPGAAIPLRRGRSTAPVGASHIVIARSRRAPRRATCVPRSTRAAARAASLAGVAACSAARSRTPRLSHAPPAAHAGRRRGSQTARRPSRASPFASADDATRRQAQPIASTTHLNCRPGCRSALGALLQGSSVPGTQSDPLMTRGGTLDPQRC